MGSISVSQGSQGPEIGHPCLLVSIVTHERGSVKAEAAGWFAYQESWDSTEFKTIAENNRRSKRFQEVRFHPRKCWGTKRGIFAAVGQKSF
jgi:hypothetical protein